MTPYKQKQKQKRRKNLFRKWHRRVGFAAAAFLINLAVTGILLNHSESLELHEQYVTSDWLTDWYGISAPAASRCFELQDHKTSICQLGEISFVNESVLENETSVLVGVIEFSNLYYLASRDQISIYTKEWQLVETINKSGGLPTPVSFIGQLATELGSDAKTENDKSLIVIAAKDNYYSLDIDELQWRLLSSSMVNQLPEANGGVYSPTPEHNRRLQSVYRDRQVSYLKLVQDLHSGRIIYSPGKWLTDISGIIIILLAFSGFFAWQKRTQTN